MTELDQALDKAETDPEARPAFYECVLKTQFFVPTHDNPEAAPESEESVFPLIAEAEGTDFLVLFDTKERLFEWAQDEVPFICIPGHIAVEMTTPELHWAVNAGLPQQRVFTPDEITWLKKVVKQCKEIEDIQRPEEE